MKLFFSALMLSVLLIKPAFADTIVDVEKINALKKGETTSDFVLTQFGKPDHEDRNPDGRYVLLYQFSFPGKTADQAPLNGKAAFLFGTDGKLMGIRFYKQD